MEEKPKYGEPKKFDPDFKGPIQNRGCTDIVCCIFFIVAIVGYVAVGILAWTHGDPRKVIYPTDSMGQYCGQGTLEKKPLLFYFNMMKCASPMVLLEFQCPTPQVCVLSTCFCLKLLIYMPLLQLQLQCSSRGYLLLIHICFDNQRNATVVMEGRQVAMKIFEDYTKSWYWILICLLIAVVLSLIFIVLLRYLAGIMVWVMILMVIAVVACGMVWFTHFNTFILSSILLNYVVCVLPLSLVFLSSFRAVGYVMSSLFYPIFTFFLLTIVIAYWGITAVFLSTSSEPVYKVFNETDCPHGRQTCEPENFTISAMKTDCPRSECLFAFYGGETPYHKYLIFFQFYNVFLFFWCANFVTALGQMTLAGAFASYYWAPNKPNDMPSYPLCASLGRSLRYHTGSLAFGSLILAIVQIIRVLLEYIDHKLKVSFLPQVAIYGKNFCRSACDAFFLLMRNVIRVVVLDKVTDFILFLGKLLIVGLVGIFAFFFFSGHTDAFKGAAPSLHYYWVPILTVLVGSYFIAHGFFSVYAMCVDTLFLCFLEDLERNDGSPERPYLMSEKLLNVLKKKNQAN
uniref:Choline transporter-like protein n=1 Tax=Cyprinus carpio TaxID=7962 RepID=A0A8C2F634_CYPCA